MNPTSHEAELRARLDLLEKRHQQRLNTADGLSQVEELVECCAAHPELLGEALRLLGLTRAKRRDNAAAIAALERSVATFRGVRSARGLGEVYDTLGQVHAACGRLDLAAASYAQALAFKQSSDDRAGIAITLGNLGRLHSRAGRLREARECFELDLALARELRDTLGVARMHVDLGVVAIDEGDFEQAERWLRDALALAIGDAAGQAFFAHKELARVAFECADAAAFDAHASAASASLTSGHEPYLDTLLDVLRARERLRRGDRTALALLATCAHQLGEADLPDHEVPARLELARALARLGSPVAAEQQLHLARSRVRRFGLERLARLVDTAYLELDVTPGAVEERERFDTGAVERGAERGDHGYHVLAPLGHGRFGAAFKVYDPDAGDVRVLKLLRLEHVYDGHVRRILLESARRELLAASRLRHPGIARVLALGESTSGERYVVQEWIDGSTLEDWIGGAGRNEPLGRRFACLAAIAHSLNVLHANGVVHRDLKPANVMLRHGDPDEPVLIDFGISSCAELPADRSAVTGTREYIAPEQFAGRDVDGRADVYSLGIVAREMLAGEDARGNGTLVMAPDLSPTGMPTITLWRPDLPEELAQLFDAMVERDPAARPLAREVTDALATWCES